MMRLFSELRMVKHMVELARHVDKQPHRRTSMRRSRRGAVQVEYAFLLVFIMVPTAGILLAVGRTMLTEYISIRGSILSSMP